MISPNNDIGALLRAQLTASFQPIKLELRDDSAAHAGHAGAKSGAHFAVHIVSAKFAGCRTLERHRMVYAAAADLMTTRIHALQISALSPEETGVTQ
jgi:BolA family transcriptional regulator, general stress-responsive regulator